MINKNQYYYIISVKCCYYYYCDANWLKIHYYSARWREKEKEKKPRLWCGFAELPERERKV